MNLIYAKNDSDWSKQVLEKNNGYCILCGNVATPAHVFRRGYLCTRLVVENGVPLCVICHGWFDSLSELKHEKAGRFLVGDLVYDCLEELNKNG